MNGYKLLADSYKKLVETNQIDKKDADSYIKIYNFLATGNDKEKEILFKSSVFNNMIIEFINKLDLNVKIKINIIEQLYNIWN